MIINLTQHAATPEQQKAGVVDFSEPNKSALIQALTFTSLPTRREIEDRAAYIAGLAVFNNFGPDDDNDPHFHYAMIGGAPYLMAPLESALLDQGITPVYAFSVRESVESIQPDGTVKKTAVFKHAGFIGL